MAIYWRGPRPAEEQSEKPVHKLGHKSGRKAKAKKPRGSYWLKVYVHRNGIRECVRESLETADEKEALRRAVLREQDLRNPPPVAVETGPKDTPVEEFWPLYLEYSKAHKAENTWKIEEYFWGAFKRIVGPASLGRVSVKDVDRFKLEWAKEVSPRTVNNAVKMLKAIFNYALKREYYTGKNPFVGIELLPDKKRPPRFLTPEQVEAVMAEATAWSQKNPNALLIFALGIHCGMRKGEIANARWEWFDFERKTVTIQSEPERGPRGKGWDVKDRDYRTVPLKDKLIEILLTYRKDSGYVLESDRPSEGKAAYRYEIRMPFGTVLRHVQKKKEEEAKKAERELEPEWRLTEWVTPHVLRHTFGSLAAQAGVSLYQIQEWMGHESFETTQIYAHLQKYSADINRF